LLKLGKLLRHSGRSQQFRECPGVVRRQLEHALELVGVIRARDVDLT
jgi:hypothetical protein